MRGQLGIGAVDPRVIQVRPVHPGLEVVRDQPGRHPAEELERRHVALGPGPLVHPDHRADEQVPRAAQHHRERPDRVAAARSTGSSPAAQLAVVDLRLLARPAGCQPQHPHLRPAGLLGQVRRHIPAQRGHRRRQPPLIAQPLMDRGHRDPGLQLRARCNRGAPRSPARSPAAAGYRPAPGTTPAPAPPTPPALTGGPPGTMPAASAARQVLAHRLPRQPQAASDLVLRPARMPVREDLADIDHVERPPRHRPPVPRTGE